MNSNLALIITVLLAVLIIGGAVTYAFIAANQGSSAVTDGAAPAHVAIPAVMTSCSTGDRCLVVDTACGFCGQYAAVNMQYEKAFEDIFNTSCARYDGPPCSHVELDAYPSCQAGQCTLVRFP